MCYGPSSNLDLFRICMDLNIFGLIMSRDNGKPEDKTPLVTEAFYYALVKGLWIFQSFVKHLKCIHSADLNLFNNHRPYPPKKINIVLRVAGNLIHIQFFQISDNPGQKNCWSLLARK